MSEPSLTPEQRQRIGRWMEYLDYTTAFQNLALLRDLLSAHDALVAQLQQVTAERDRLERDLAVQLDVHRQESDRAMAHLVAGKERERRIAQLEAERDRLDCTRREGGDTRHCRVDAKCLRCRLEAEHIPREDRERALEVAAQWGSIPSPDIGGPNFIGTEPRKARLRAEARRLLKLEDQP